MVWMDGVDMTALYPHHCYRTRNDCSLSIARPRARTHIRTRKREGREAAATIPTTTTNYYYYYYYYQCQL